MTDAIRERLRELLDALGNRKRAYQQVFGNPVGQSVLRDLMAFCKFDDTTHSDDELQTARLNGRREVMLRIQKHLHYTPEQLYAIYSGQTVKGDKK